MARIAAGIPDLIWAETPASADDVIAPSDARQATGYDNPYFQPGGSLPEGEFYNWLERRVSAFKRDVGRHGVLEWDNRQNFEHPAACLADNNHLYLSTQDSGPDMPGGAVNPTGATGSTRWRLAGSSNQFVPAAQVTGTADAILLAPDPSFTVYEVGQTLIFRAEGDSTAGVTVNVSGLGAQALHFSDAQAGAGDIMNGFFYTIRYDGTNFVIVAESGFHILPVARGGTGVGSIADLLTALNIGNRLLPDGGTTGQVLGKDSAGNYDVSWRNVAAAGLQTLTEGDHIEITGTGDTREIAVDTGTTQGDLAELGTGGRFAPARVPMIEDLDGSLAASDIPNLQNLNGTLDVASGGTGATDATGARSNLGLGTAATEDTGTTQGDLAVLQASGLFDPDRIPNLQNLNGTLDVASGGTGADNAADARTNLGISPEAFRAVLLSTDEDVVAAGTVNQMTVTSFADDDYRWLQVIARLPSGGRVAGLLEAADVVGQNFPQTVNVDALGYIIDSTTRALYRANIANGTATRVHSTNTIIASGVINAAFGDGTSDGYAITNGRRLIEIDVSDGSGTDLGGITGIPNTIQAATQHDSAVYLVSSDNLALYTLDVQTRAATRVHASNTVGNVKALFSLNGVLYGILNRVLYQIDTTNGTATRVHGTNMLSVTTNGSLDAAFVEGGNAYIPEELAGGAGALWLINVGDGTSSRVHATNTLGIADLEAAFNTGGQMTINAPLEGVDLNGPLLKLWRQDADPDTRIRARLDDADDDITIEQIIGVA